MRAVVEDSAPVADHSCHDTRAKVTGRIDGVRCLHTPSGAETEDKDDDDEREEAGGRRAVAFVCYGEDYEYKDERAEDFVEEACGCGQIIKLRPLISTSTFRKSRKDSHTA